MADRRSGSWLTPSTIISIVMAVISIGSFYVISERRTATLEANATTFNEKATRIEGQLGAILTSIQAVTTVTTRLEARDDARTREIEEIKRKLELQDVYNDDFQKKLIELNAELKNRSKP